MNFVKPEALNGAQLMDELKTQGIIVEKIEDNGKGQISFDVAKDKESIASSIVAAHVGIDKEPTVLEKLQSVGISIDDLKVALGL
jgi:hypothetical protein